MLQTPPEGGWSGLFKWIDPAPVALGNREIRVWIHIPENVVLGRAVGGVQLFVKDSHWRSLYGNYIALTTEAFVNNWVMLTLVPGAKDVTLGAYRDPDFDLREVIAVGLRLDACGHQDCLYDGVFFLDTVSW